MAAKGRIGSTGRFTDTVARKSALQAVLIKQDIILEALRAVRDGADLAAVQTALGLLDITDVELKD